MTPKKEIETLRAELERHNRLYYLEATPEISDFEFDQRLKRLQELLSGDAKGSQLGLYRIGHEGEFELSYVFTDNNLTIRATRGLG